MIDDRRRNRGRRFAMVGSFRLWLTCSGPSCSRDLDGRIEVFPACFTGPGRRTSVNEWPTPSLQGRPCGIDDQASGNLQRRQLVRCGFELHLDRLAPLDVEHHDLSLVTFLAHRELPRPCLEAFE